MFNFIEGVGQYIRQGEEQNLRATTLKNRRNFCRRLLNFIHDKPLDLEIASEYISQLKISEWSPASLVGEIKQVKSLANFLYLKGFIADNWTKKMASPRIHHIQPQLVSQELADKIIEAGTEVGPGDRSRSIRIKDDVRRLK